MDDFALMRWWLWRLKLAGDLDPKGYEVLARNDGTVVIRPKDST